MIYLLLNLEESVIVRGIEKKEIVTDNTDRKNFGHSVIIGKQKNKWQNRGYVLRYFGEKESAAQKISGSRRHPVCRVRLRISIMLFSEYGIPITEIARNTGVLWIEKISFLEWERSPLRPKHLSTHGR